MNYWQKQIDGISNWMREYLEGSGCKGFVVGLSGGIDSSLIYCLSIKAVGKKNVIGVIIPCYSSRDSVIDAGLLTRNYDKSFLYKPIEEAYNSIVLSTLEMPKNDNNQLLKANIKARLRMIILYSIAGDTNFLVAGTGNLSELNVGYGTKFGDLACDIESIGNYYKTEIYEMAKLMPGIPKNILEKPPSADLWEGQKDEDELGMKYELLDKILYAIDEKGRTELDSFPTDKVKKVQKMIKNAIHKNNLPPRYIRE